MFLFVSSLGRSNWGRIAQNAESAQLKVNEEDKLRPELPTPFNRAQKGNHDAGYLGYNGAGYFMAPQRV